MTVLNDTRSGSTPLSIMVCSPVSAGWTLTACAQAVMAVGRGARGARGVRRPGTARAPGRGPVGDPWREYL